MRRRLGRCKPHRNHPSQPPTGWDDCAKPPRHHRTQSAGRQPGWRRKREKAEGRNGNLATTLPFPLLPAPQSSAGLQTHWRKWGIELCGEEKKFKHQLWETWDKSDFSRQTNGGWKFEAHRQYLGTQLVSLSVKRLFSFWGVSAVRMSEQLKAGGDSQMQSEISFSLTMASSSSSAESSA